MANIKFNILSGKSLSNLNVRFYHGKLIDCNARTNILIDPKNWSNKMQNLKPSVDKKLKKHYSEKIENLRNEIILKFNEDFSNGINIDSKWLNATVEQFYSRPTSENDYSKIFTSFIDKFITESKTRMNAKTGNPISKKTIQKYNTTLKRIKEFEDIENQKIKLIDVNLSFHKKITTYLKVEHNYSNTLIEKIVSQIKTFIREAKLEGYETSIEVENRNFSFTRDETIDTYLNEIEINKIFNLDFANNDRLDNVRDLFIMGLRTGLRISDLKRISEFVFSSNSILISGTEKTDSSVEIPIHPQIKQILEKREHKLPRIISDQKFNEYVKELCLIAGFDQKILGKLKNPKTNRKEKGYFQKYKLISSHTCRRSFATNLYGKIDDKTIMAITTHKSHSQFMSYIKTTQKEHVEKLADYWKNEI